MADLNALIQNHLVRSGAVVVVLAAAVAGGYFLGTGHGGSGGTASSGGGTAVAEQGICQATLARVQDYGITDAKSQLTSNKPTSTDTKNRVVCTAKDGGMTYTITVDVLCKDMSDSKCLKLYHISDSAGTTIYQRTHFLKPN